MSESLGPFGQHARKEGSTAVHVFALIVPIVFTVILAFLLNFHSRYTSAVCRFFVEFIVLVYTTVLHVTVLSDYIGEVLVFWIILAGVSISVNLCKWAAARDIEQDPSDGDGYLSGFRAARKRIQAKASSVEVSGKQPGHVTMLRATTFLLTAVCILAVDFKVFPGDSFKTHKYGFSLMDVGIGLFVCSIAMVSNKPPLWHYCSAKRLFRLLWNIVPFLVLGVGRVIVIEQIEYNQSVTEYGKHWNAFLTLGFTKLFATLMASAVPRVVHLILLAAVVLGLNEVALQQGLAEFVMNGDVARDTFLTANREGIVSIPGFVALYLATMYLGHLLRSDSEWIGLGELAKKTGIFGLLSAALWIVVLQSGEIFAVSRRICNAGYVLWIICILTSISALFMSVEAFAAVITQRRTKDRSRTYIPMIMRSINYNGLFFFLMANVLTGVVNMSIATNKVDTLHSLAILMAYMLVNCSVITIFCIKNWRIKFW